MLRVLLALLALAPAAVPAAASARPAVTLTRSAPATFHGTGFHHHEHVRLILRRSACDVELRRVTASTTGTFTAAFRAVDLSPCSAFTLSAFGDSGSRAGAHRLHPLHVC